GPRADSGRQDGRSAAGGGDGRAGIAAWLTLSSTKDATSSVRVNPANASSDAEGTKRAQRSSLANEDRERRPFKPFFDPMTRWVIPTSELRGPTTPLGNLEK